ncbi:hypothetical protein I553_9219 [Mycobacterium xenopi 4042]|uniref:Uncharacterized protein n=1 Tax=Mycobacterium xenopi 4042 TaxID=1299334 RepID=X8A7L8_MYCXE|nr:hypothetical protein I553_9219 [Mycobacterium xenopi 4042]
MGYPYRERRPPGNLEPTTQGRKMTTMPTESVAPASQAEPQGLHHQ